MGCSNSNSEDVKFSSIKPKEKIIDEVPYHGANELPPMQHEPDFEPDQQIAWIIDDAVAKTKPLPKHKQVVKLADDGT